jgi:hypothetical protein
MSRDHGGGKSGERPRSTGEESWEKDQLAYRPELKSALGSKKKVDRNGRLFSDFMSTREGPYSLQFVVSFFLLLLHHSPPR